MTDAFIVNHQSLILPTTNHKRNLARTWVTDNEELAPPIKQTYHGQGLYPKTVNKTPWPTQTFTHNSDRHTSLR